VTEPVRRALEEEQTVHYLASSSGTQTEFADELERFGIGSLAGVPLTHQGLRFGVLGVYGTEQAPVGEDELELLEEFADTVGYAVHTSEFKRSLLSEQKTTITFTLSDGSVP